MSDPLQHLAFLGRMARKALLVWTYTGEKGDEELESRMFIRYHATNKYYKDRTLPYCLDSTEVSPAL